MAQRVGKIRAGKVRDTATGDEWVPADAEHGLEEGTSVVFDTSEEGERLVDILQTPPIRPLFVQRAPKDCAIAAVRMAFATATGEDPGFDLAKRIFTDLEAYDSFLGADFEKLGAVFGELAKRAFFWRLRLSQARKLNQERLAPLVTAYRPAIAILKDPNHVVVVDSVERGKFPAVTIRYRDPAKLSPSTFVKTGMGVENEEGDFGVRATGLFYVLEG